MRQAAATLDPDGVDVTNLPLTQPGNMREPRGPATKFLYPSGSRPLDGYTIKRGIGRGGFGEVYYATSDGGKEVALKLIRRNLDVELRGVAHCLNLKHPNLLALFDIRTDADDDTWVVMEYLHGETLDEAIARNPQGMPLADVLMWLQGIAAGVGYLHDHGIVHRDLKPGNIFCDEGIVKLGDYGLSKFISASRRSGQTESVGTVHYMAPEVANGRYGKEIDIYALGVIFYEMLTGRVPFEGESVGEVLMKHLTAHPDVSSIAEPFRSLVARMLDKDPARRPQSVAEVLAALPVAGATAQPAYATALGGATGTTSPVMGTYVATATFTPSTASEEEPIWKAVKENWHQLYKAWNDAELNLIARTVIIALVLVVLVSTHFLWIPALLIYAVYLVVRSIVLSSGKPGVITPTLATPGPQSSVPPATAASTSQPSPVVLKRVIAETPAAALPVQDTREKLTELISSMLLSALVALVSCFAIDSLFIDLSTGGMAWLTLVSTAGAWLVLVPSKFWEGARGEEMRRRIVMVLVGLALGFYAWGLDRMLSVHPSYSLSPALRDVPLVNSTHVPVLAAKGSSGTLFDSYGRPTLVGYLAYFGILFLGPRWWRLTDPHRARRFKIWNTLMYGLWAFVLHLFWPFPEQFAVAMTMIIALSLQLSSPWVDRRARLTWDRS